MSMTTIRRFGCIRDSPKDGDKKKAYDIQAIPRSSQVDLSYYVRQIYNQGDFESCTANAVCSAYEIDLFKQLSTHCFNPSRMFLWYNSRYIEGGQELLEKNAPVTLRSTIDAFNTYGVCREVMWPYTERYDICPTYPNSYQDAQGNGIKAAAVNESLTGTDINQLRACLYEGSPVVFGFDVYSNLTSVGSDGIMPWPDLKLKTQEGHAVVAVGYNDATRYVKILNSWGKEWGKHGYFYMPYWFITSDNCHSFWKISFAYEKQAYAAAGSLPAAGQLPGVQMGPAAQYQPHSSMTYQAHGQGYQ